MKLNDFCEPFRFEDAAELFAWSSDQDTTRHIGWKRHLTIADSESAIRYFGDVKESEPPKFDRPLAFRDKKSGRAIGSGGIHQFGANIVELGWILRREVRRQGLAHEAAKALLDHAMKNLPWVNQVEARVHPENATSLRLVQKLGMLPLDDCYFNMPQLGGARTRLARFGIKKD